MTITEAGRLRHPGGGLAHRRPRRRRGGRRERAGGRPRPPVAGGPADRRPWRAFADALRTVLTDRALRARLGRRRARPGRRADVGGHRGGDPRRPRGRGRRREGPSPGRAAVAAVLAVGLTGGIGSGKSTVAELLVQRGAVLIDADRIAREVVVPGGPAYEPLVDRFGPGILAADGTLDRAALAARGLRRRRLAGRPQRHHPPRHRRRDGRSAARPRRGPTTSWCSTSPCSSRPTATCCRLARRRRGRLPGRGRRRAGWSSQRGFTRSRRRGPDGGPGRAGRSGAEGADFVIDNSADRAHLEAEVDRVWAALAGPWPQPEPGAPGPRPGAVTPPRYHRTVPRLEVVSPLRPAGDQPRAIALAGRGDRPGRPLPDPARDHRQREDGHHGLDHRGRSSGPP